MSTHSMVTSSHYLASEAGHQILKKGRNVVDVGVTIWADLTVLKPYLVGVAGEVARAGCVPLIKLKNFTEKDLFEGDTVHLDAMDQYGNMLSATPSGAWIRSSPLIPGLGFPMGTRAQMLHLDPNHVEKIEPGKKSSTTLTPSLVTKDRKPYMVFGTPGGDRQDQWTLQFFLNHIDFN